MSSKCVMIVFDLISAILQLWLPVTFVGISTLLFVKYLVHILHSLATGGFLVFAKVYSWFVVSSMILFRCRFLHCGHIRLLFCLWVQNELASLKTYHAFSNVWDSSLGSFFTTNDPHCDGHWKKLKNILTANTLRLLRCNLVDSYLATFIKSHVPNIEQETKLGMSATTNQTSIVEHTNIVVRYWTHWPDGKNIINNRSLLQIFY